MTNRSDNIAFSILQEHPSVAAGACTFVVAFALVAGNALYAQSGSHPDPLFPTRDHVTTQSLPAQTAFKPEIRKVKTVKLDIHGNPVLTNDQVKASKANQTLRSEMIATIQTALKNSGDFDGKVDGAYGPVTRQAIMLYQKRNRLVVDGEPSAGLLKVIKLNEPEIVTSSSTDELTKIIQQSVAAANTYDSKLIYKIQAGLAYFDDSEIEVDGVFGTQTATAITKFQKKHNLKITGTPDAEFLKSLIDLKALSNG